jgi:hypothetical protein
VDVASNAHAVLRWLTSQQVVAYLASVVVVLIALHGLKVDWREKYSGNRAKRLWGIALVFLTLLGGSIGVAATYYQQRDARASESERRAVQERNEADKKALQNRLDALQSTLDATRETSSANMGVLLTKVVDLGAKVKNEELRLQIGRLEQELNSTQDALKPGPLATLSIVALNGEVPASPPDNVAVPVIGRVARVEFMVTNVGEVDAHALNAWLRLSKDCDFAGNVDGFEQPEGCPSFERMAKFGTLPVHGRTRKYSVPITVGTGFTSMEVGVRVACDNCPADARYHVITATLLRVP